MAQADLIDATEKTLVFDGANAMVRPFTTAPLNLRITSITGNANGLPKVDWSDSYQGFATLAHCDVVPGFPAGLITAKDENVIMAEATYTYTSMVAKIKPGGFSFSEKFYLRPRKVARVSRAGANTAACP